MINSNEGRNSSFASLVAKRVEKTRMKLSKGTAPEWAEKIPYEYQKRILFIIKLKSPLTNFCCFAILVFLCLPKRGF